MMCVFFYGLYMDAGLLESLGYAPRVVGPARLNDYRLAISVRATLVPAEGKCSFGFLIDLSEEEVRALYARPEVQGYEPIEVTAVLLHDSSDHPAVCYVLQSPGHAGTNAAYVEKLAALVTRLGLPEGYAREIESQGNI
jgi:hypothetical protein